MMIRVRHVVPYDGVGGVEAAARSIVNPPADQDFRVVYVFPNVSSRQKRARTFDPRKIFGVACELAREKPDLVIVSLWRSALVGLLLRVLAPEVRMVLFLHNARDAHLLDRVCTRAFARVAHAVWADSAVTACARLPEKQTIRIISMLTQRLPPVERDTDEAPAPRFVYWGRLAAQKNLGRALQLFARVHALRPDARLRLIGPDGGEEGALRARARELGIEDVTSFIGPQAPDAIPPLVSDCRFFLSTSVYEGMALSVCEAMQLGLVPIVTPVGEISRYCADGHNAIVLPLTERSGDAAAVESLLALLDDAAEYSRLSARAIASFADAPLYRDSIAAAVRAEIADREDVR